MDIINISGLIQTLIGALAGGFGAYAAVRERIARLEAHVDSIDLRLLNIDANITRAHDRIDDAYYKSQR